MYLNVDFIAGSLTAAGQRRDRRRRAGGLLLVGAARPARRWPGRAPTGCCARAGSGRTATPTRSTSPGGSPSYTYDLAVEAGRRPRRSGCSAWPDWTVEPVRRAAPAAVRPAVRRHPAAGAQSVARRAGDRRSAPTWLVFWWLARPGVRRARCRWARVVTVASLAMGVAGDRVRRPQLGHGRRRLARDGGQARCCPRIGPAGAVSPVRHRPPADPGRGIALRSATSTSPTRAPTARSTPASTSTSRAGESLADRRLQRGRQDHAGQAAVPLLRPDRAARSGPTGSTCATSTSTAWRRRVAAVFQDVDAARAVAARQRRPRPPGHATPRSATRSHDAGADGLAELDTAAGQGLPGRHRPVRRAVAAGRAGPGAVRGPPLRRQRRAGAARRADRQPRRTRRGGDLPAAAARRREGATPDPDLAPVLDRPAWPTGSRSSTRDGSTELGTPRGADRRATAATRGSSTLQASRFDEVVDDEGVEYEHALTATTAVRDEVGAAARRRWRRCGGWCKLGYQHEPRPARLRRGRHRPQRDPRRAARAVADAARRRRGRRRRAGR